MTTSEEMKQRLQQFQEDFEALRAEVAKVIVGQDETVEEWAELVATV